MDHTAEAGQHCGTSASSAAAPAAVQRGRGALGTAGKLPALQSSRAARLSIWMVITLVMFPPVSLTG